MTPFVKEIKRDRERERGHDERVIEQVWVRSGGGESAQGYTLLLVFSLTVSVETQVSSF